MGSPTMTALLMATTSSCLLGSAMGIAARKPARVSIDSDIHTKDMYGSMRTSLDSLGKESVEEADQSYTGVNLCSEERLFPEAYFLGAPRSGSSTFSHDLVKAGVKVASGKSDTEVAAALDSGHWAGSGAKEWHFFESWALIGNGREDAEKAEWMSKLPECPSDSDKRVVLVDFTPSALRMAPLPPDAETAPDVMGKKMAEARGFKAGGRELLKMPEKIEQFYGERRKNVTFLILLREPLSRLQSAWYIDRHLPAPAEFEDAVKDALSKLHEQPPKYNDWLWASMYSWGVKGWLEHYHPNQFVIMLTKNYLRDRSGTCEKLADRWNLKLKCDIDDTTHLNGGEHPNVQDDLSNETRAEIEKVLDEDRQQLVTLLSKAHEDGATLIDYTGDVGEKDAIEAWLQSGW